MLMRASASYSGSHSQEKGGERSSGEVSRSSFLHKRQILIGLVGYGAGQGRARATVGRGKASAAAEKRVW